VEVGTAILGLDISTKTGWAVWRDGEIIEKGVFHVEPPKSKDPIARFSRWRGYRSHLGDILVTYNPVYAFVEGYGYANAHTLVTLVELSALLKAELMAFGLPWTEVPPTTLKKFLTGSGKAEKQKMLLEVYKRFAIDCKTNDEADAVTLAYFGAAARGLYDGLPKAQIQLAKQYVQGE
jgi:crossover junction endodeoxyribonuclease RuvC